MPDKIKYPGRESLGYPGHVQHRGDPKRKETPCEETYRIRIANRIGRAEDQLAYDIRRTVVRPGDDMGTGADDEPSVQPAMARPATGVRRSKRNQSGDE